MFLRQSKTLEEWMCGLQVSSRSAKLPRNMGVILNYFPHSRDTLACGLLGIVHRVRQVEVLRVLGATMKPELPSLK